MSCMDKQDLEMDDDLLTRSEKIASYSEFLLEMEKRGCCLL